MLQVFLNNISIFARQSFLTEPTNLDTSHFLDLID